MSVRMSSWCCCSWCSPRTNVPTRRARLVAALVQEVLHAPVDLRAIARDLGHRRPREQAAAVAGDPLAHGIVIGIEQEGISRINGRGEPRVLEARMKVSKNHECMGQVPLGRAGVGHRLDDVVLDLQRCAEGLGGAAGPRGSRSRSRLESRPRFETAGPGSPSAGAAEAAVASAVESDMQAAPGCRGRGPVPSEAGRRNILMIVVRSRVPPTLVADAGDGLTLAAGASPVAARHLFPTGRGLLEGELRALLWAAIPRVHAWPELPGEGGRRPAMGVLGRRRADETAPRPRLRPCRAWEPAGPRGDVVRSG